MEDEDQPTQWLHSEHSSAPGEIFGEPVTKTRIGGEYQALIPPLMTDNERLHLPVLLPFSHDDKIDVQDQLLFGQSIPVMWIQEQPETMQNQANAQGSVKGESGVLGPGLLLPVPCSSTEPLSPDEHHSFLLALYIFGNNFHVVNRFMGDKGMRNVLSYYYGKFYKTDEHQIWLRYKKLKGNKNTIPGKNIFSNWRQEELFSRIFPHVTDECRTSLTHASKTFEDGELSFEAYVFTVRDILGIDLLIDAIGIGKGKQDLTCRSKKPVKNKIPHSSLNKTEEIINLLNNRNGLNKAKLSELFWKAVWPRLTSRGWHSEKTINYTFQRSKKSMVFLAPGIRKFSRRALDKGTQYFESFKDVLNKVASEPELLELIQDKPVVKQTHMQFTIVDSGFARVENGIVRMSELRSFSDSEPTDDIQESFSSGGSGETIHNSNNPDSDGGVNTDDQEAQLNGETHLLTAKGLEAVSSESRNVEKKKRDVEEKGDRHVRAKTAFVTTSDSQDYVDGP